MQTRVAETGNSMQKDSVKSVCRELPPWRWLHEGHACIVFV